MYYSVLTFLFFSVFAADFPDSMPVSEQYDDLSPRRRPANMESVARLTLVDQAAAGGGRYYGMNVFLETRDAETKKYLWFANVRFSGQCEGVLPDAAVVESFIRVNYYTCDGYFEAGMNYGGSAEYSTPLCIDSPPIQFFRGNNEYIDVNEVKHNNHRELFQYSILEFPLDQSLSIRGLREHLNGMKLRKRSWLGASYDYLPRYTRAGYSHKEQVYNCCTFSAALLEKLGVPIRSNSSSLCSYLDFKAGSLLWWSVGGMVVGSAGAAAAVALCPATAPVVAALRGVRLLYAVGAGCAVGAGGGVAVDIAVDTVHPWYVIDEIIKVHDHIPTAYKPKFILATSDLRNADIGEKRKARMSMKREQYNNWQKLFAEGGALQSCRALYNI